MHYILTTCAHATQSKDEYSPIASLVHNMLFQHRQWSAETRAERASEITFSNSEIRSKSDHCMKRCERHGPLVTGCLVKPLLGRRSTMESQTSRCAKALWQLQSIQGYLQLDALSTHLTQRPQLDSPNPVLHQRPLAFSMGLHSTRRLVLRGGRMRFGTAAVKKGGSEGSILVRRPADAPRAQANTRCSAAYCGAVHMCKHPKCTACKDSHYFSVLQQRMRPFGAAVEAPGSGVLWGSSVRKEEATEGDICGEEGTVWPGTIRAQSAVVRSLARSLVLRWRLPLDRSPPCLSPQQPLPPRVSVTSCLGCHRAPISPSLFSAKPSVTSSLCTLIRHSSSRGTA
ncbi:hypothetical protein FKP32DRAFT_1337927 [Trametes sanguinea]|nr:hypothetical protein FKP32DRAFT_1337927 [Trametes sanguinea]